MGMRLRFTAKCEGCFGVSGRRDRGRDRGVSSLNLASPLGEEGHEVAKGCSMVSGVSGRIGGGIGGAPDGAVGVGIGTGTGEPRFTPVILSESEGTSVDQSQQPPFQMGVC